LARGKKIVGIVFSTIVAVVVMGISFTIGWRPFIGPKGRPLTARTFERTAERLERGKYLVEGVLGCFDCHSERDWNQPGAPVIEAQRGGGALFAGGPPGRLIASNISPDPETGADLACAIVSFEHKAFNPIALALVSGATYVARAFSGDPDHMSRMIAGGIEHRGFALIDVFSPCVTYNKLNTYPWFRERVYKLEGEPGYDASDVRAAVNKSFEWGDRIPIGLFFAGLQPTYEDSEPAFKKGPLAHQPLGLDRAVFDEFVEEFA